VLHQVPGPLPVVGIAFVVAAGIGAERTGARVPPYPTGVVPARAVVSKVRFTRRERRG
jgi:hypothetical protein